MKFTTHRIRVFLKDIMNMGFLNSWTKLLKIFSLGRKFHWVRPDIPLESVKPRMAVFRVGYREKIA